MKDHQKQHYSGASAKSMDAQNAGIAGAIGGPGSCAPRGVEGSEAAMREEQAAQQRSQVNMASYDDMSSQSRVDAVINRMIQTPPSPTDPNGSYTGKPMKRGEKPVQDADDL